MTTPHQDTDPAIVQRFDARYARMSPSDKLRRIRQLTLAVAPELRHGVEDRAGQLHLDLLAVKGPVATPECSDRTDVSVPLSERGRRLSY